MNSVHKKPSGSSDVIAYDYWLWGQSTIASVVESTVFIFKTEKFRSLSCTRAIPANILLHAVSGVFTYLETVITYDGGRMEFLTNMMSEHSQISFTIA